MPSYRRNTCRFVSLLSLLTLSLLTQAVKGVRLKFSDVECFRENIPVEDSEVTLTVVADDLYGKSVYVDVMARDPNGEAVFSKLDLNDAELNFKNNKAGLHTFCFKVSQKSRTKTDSISSPRVKKTLRTITVDVQVALDDKVTENDVDEMMDEVTDVQRRVQHCCYCGGSYIPNNKTPPNPAAMPNSYDNQRSYDRRSRIAEGGRTSDRLPLLPVIPVKSRYPETQKIVPNNLNLSIYAGTTAGSTALTVLSMQRLVGTMVHLKMTGAQHRDLVVSKNRTVTFFSVGKLVVLVAMFAAQPVVVRAWFGRHRKY